MVGVYPEALGLEGLSALQHLMSFDGHGGIRGKRTCLWEPSILQPQARRLIAPAVAEIAAAGAVEGSGTSMEI